MENQSVGRTIWQADANQMQVENLQHAVVELIFALFAERWATAFSSAGMRRALMAMAQQRTDPRRMRPRKEGRVSLASVVPKGDGNEISGVSSGACGPGDNVDMNISHCNIDYNATNGKQNSSSVGVATRTEQPTPFVDSAAAKPSKQKQDKTPKHFVDFEAKAGSDASFENLLCIEIFSGSGRLTATIRHERQVSEQWPLIETQRELQGRSQHWIWQSRTIWNF